MHKTLVIFIRERVQYNSLDLFGFYCPRLVNGFCFVHSNPDMRRVNNTMIKQRVTFLNKIRLGQMPTFKSKFKFHYICNNYKAINFK